MQLCEDPDELRRVVATIVKNSKKLKNANLLVNHIKASIEASHKLTTGVDYEQAAEYNHD